MAKDQVVAERKEIVNGEEMTVKTLSAADKLKALREQEKALRAEVQKEKEAAEAKLSPAERMKKKLVRDFYQIYRHIGRGELEAAHKKLQSSAPTLDEALKTSKK